MTSPMSSPLSKFHPEAWATESLIHANGSIAIYRVIEHPDIVHSELIMSTDTRTFPPGRGFYEARSQAEQSRNPQPNFLRQFSDDHTLAEIGIGPDIASELHAAGYFAARDLLGNEHWRELLDSRDQRLVEQRLRRFTILTKREPYAPESQ